MSWPPAIPDHQLIRKIGEGGYGEVWLARSVTGGWRAVKLVSRKRFEDARPFQREFEGLREFAEISLREPRQLSLLHVGLNEAEGFLYAIMELADDVVHGTTILPDEYVPHTVLSQWRDRGRLPVSEVVRLGRDFAQAIHSLHSHGLVHRDIKPSNFIFVRGVAKLSDVGLVTTPRLGMSFVGTDGYVPREGPGSVRADIYALGKVLFQLSSGHPCSRFPDPPFELAAMPDRAMWFELNEVILRACDPDPSARYASAAEVDNDLALISSGESVVKLRRIEKAARTLKRLGIVLALLAAVAGTWAWTQSAIARREAALRYQADLKHAAAEVLRGRFGLARASVPASDPNGNDRIERFLLARQAQGHPTISFQIFDEAVTQMAFDPTGKRMAVSAENSQLKIVEVPSGRILTSIQPIGRLAGFSPDGLQLFGTLKHGSNQELRIWDAATGVLSDARCEGSWLPLGISPKGEMVAVSFQPPFQRARWNGLPGGEEISALPGTCAEFPTISGFLANRSFERTLLQLYKVESNPAVSNGFARWDHSRTECKWDQIEMEHTVIALSPSGNEVAYVRSPVEGETSTAEIVVASWDDPSRVRMAIRGFTATPRVLSFSPDGMKLAVGMSDEHVGLYSLEKREWEHNWVGHRASVSSLQWFPDGLQLASGDSRGEVRLWNVLSPPPSDVQPGFAESRRMMAMIADSRETILAIPGKEAGTVQFWSIEPWAVLYTNHEISTPLAFIDDSRDTLLAIDKGGRLVEMLGDTVNRRMEVFPKKLTADDEANLYGVASPDRAHVLLHRDGGQDRRSSEVVWWDVKAGKGGPVIRENTDRIDEVCFSGDSKAAVSVGNNEIIIWDVIRGAVSRRIEVGSSEVLRSCCFLPDGETCLLGGNMAILKRLDIGSGKVFRMANSDLDDVLYMRVVDGRVVSGGGDGMIGFQDAHVPGPGLTSFSHHQIQSTGVGTDREVVSLLYLPRHRRLLGMTTSGWMLRW